MQEWINSVLSVDNAGIIVFAAVFLLGIVSVFTCACNFVAIGAIAGYTGTVGATSKTKTVVVSSLFFLLGALIALSAIGCLVGYASEWVGTTMGNYWKIAAGLVAIFFGVFTLDILPFKIKGISSDFQNKKGSMTGAILFGFIMGGIIPLSNLCCNPFFPIVMAASFVKGSAVWGFAMLFSFALGYGLTIAAAMLGLGLGLGKMSKMLSKFAVGIKYAGGITLIVLGFYFLLTI